jgi:molybdopterin/thiamine biosynthesis adenylyltransferase
MILPELTEVEIERYKRQMMQVGFGGEGQRRLKGASALVTRVGGLGGPVAMYLAIAGIGRLIIAHGGTLTHSNLNRQILMRADGVGLPRIPQAVETLRRIAPDCDVTGLAANADDTNAEEWVSQVDIVCDTTPTFEERFALNRACWKLGRPLLDAGMNGMECQLSVLVPGETACLECYCPQAPDWWEPLGFPVIGAVSGMLGCITAMEAIKLLSGCGEPLKGKLLTIDMDDLTMTKYNLVRRPDCPVCGG